MIGRLDLKMLDMKMFRCRVSVAIIRRHGLRLRRVSFIRSKGTGYVYGMLAGTCLTVT